MIMIGSKSQLTIDIITKISQNKITISNAALLLNRSRRTIERYLNQYQQLGIQFRVFTNIYNCTVTFNFRERIFICHAGLPHFKLGRYD